MSPHILKTSIHHLLPVPDREEEIASVDEIVAVGL